VSSLFMETIPGSSSKLSLGSEVATGDAGISSRNLFTDNELPSSVHTVVSHDDLLIEILLRLPILSLILFKSVSKHWLSLIRNINPTLRRTTNPNLDPPTGLFIQRLESPSLYDFVSLDSRILSRIYPIPFKFIFRLNSQIRFNILESCNGLLLCEGVNQDNMIIRDMYCIFNPSVNLFKMLPKRHDPSLTRVKPIIKIAFDPRKSPHYNVIGILDGFDKIEIYSSKTGSWSVCRIPNISRIYFQWGINWNNAIHWLDNEKGPLHFKLDILNEHPIITKIQLPVTVDKRMPWDRKLFESRGCLLLLGVDYKYSQQFNIYEMSNVSSEWSVKYNFNLDDNIILWPRTISCNVWCIVLGEREEDSSIVMELDKKVVEYKIRSKNFRELYDMRGHALRGFQFFASFAGPEHDGTCSRESDTLSFVMDSLVCNAVNSVVLSSSKDRWTCDLSGDGEFKVKVIRNFIDDLFLPSSDVATRWVKFIPIKVNVFSWRARRDRLPTRVNLSRRGVLLDSHLCPLCNAAMEDVQPVFFHVK
ncbi:F-box protein-like protein isoform X1, partial [Tanacetum coccineum]